MIILILIQVNHYWIIFIEELNQFLCNKTDTQDGKTVISNMKSQKNLYNR